MLYLGFETPLGSPGTGPSTLSSRVGGLVINPLLRCATGMYLLRSFNRPFY
jgi:hypothetical protein